MLIAWGVGNRWVTCVPHSEEFGFSLGQKSLASQPQSSLDSGVRGIRRREGKRLRREILEDFVHDQQKGPVWEEMWFLLAN